MAVDMFLKLDTIKGESTDEKHKDEINIDSFSFEVLQQGTGNRAGGMGAGKAEFKDVTFEKQTDSASPLLMQACAGGDHIKSAILYVRKAGGKQQDYYKVTFSDLLISSFVASGEHDGDLPKENFTLNFSKVEFSYKPQKVDGTLGAESKGGWDLKANKKV